MVNPGPDNIDESESDLSDNDCALGNGIVVDDFNENGNATAKLPTTDAIDNESNTANYAGLADRDQQHCNEMPEPSLANSNVDSDTLYEVERVTASKRKKNRLFFQVKWKNFVEPTREIGSNIPFELKAKIFY